MSKKRIIIIAAVGLVSFAGSFIVAWFTRPGPAASQAEEVGQTESVSQGTELFPSEDSAIAPVTISAGELKKSMTERQLKSLVYEVREKIREYNGKLNDLKVLEKRIHTAQELLKKDIDELSDLRIELASTVAGLKDERDKLLKSRVRIAETEKGNLISIAAAYDKMDAASAGKILTAMCGDRTQDGEFGDGSNNLDDAVKILNYMTERTKAKLLAELVTSEPKLAAVLCRKLKKIIEE